MLGDSIRELNHPRLLPIFFGIMLGVFLGSLPVFVPGLPAAVKLGLASGPMIVAIILARLGRIGPLIWYMPNNASSMLKELGIALFLIAVGLLAGDGFFETLRKPIGVELLWQGAVVTIVPLLVVGWLAKVIFKVRYLHVCGLLAGSMTSPSLAYTGTMTTSEAPNVAFATASVSADDDFASAGGAVAGAGVLRCGAGDGDEWRGDAGGGNREVRFFGRDMFVPMGGVWKRRFADRLLCIANVVQWLMHNICIEFSRVEHTKFNVLISTHETFLSPVSLTMMFATFFFIDQNPGR